METTRLNTRRGSADNNALKKVAKEASREQRDLRDHQHERDRDRAEAERERQDIERNARHHGERDNSVEENIVQTFN